MLLTTIGEGGRVKGDTHSIRIFLKLFNIIYENDFLNKIFKIILVA
jgi:hypothetical protein